MPQDKHSYFITPSNSKIKSKKLNKKQDERTNNINKRIYLHNPKCLHALAQLAAAEGLELSAIQAGPLPEFF